MLRTVAVALVGEVRWLNTRITAADKQITTAVAGTGTTLTELYGVAHSSPGRSWPMSAPRHRHFGSVRAPGSCQHGRSHWSALPASPWWA